MPSKSDRYVEFVVEQLSPLGEITARAMMGGWVLYCDAVVFALVDDGALYLKGDAVNIPHFEARGLRPFQPFGDGMSMKYYQAPPEIFEDERELRRWVGGAVEAGQRAKAGKGRKTPAAKPAKAKKTAKR